jgi:segregation and condensation protein B
VSEQPNLSAIDPDESQRRSLIEAIVYVAEEPLTLVQIAKGLDLAPELVQADLDALTAQYAKAERGIEIRKVAQGYKMSTKAEHHDGVRKFVKTLRPKLKLSLPALETLAVIAYKQPATVPEIQAVRGVNSTGVISTLLSRKLITTAGRKAVIGRPMQYKTTKEFLIQFGLSDLTELPTLKELEELGRAALGEMDEGEEVEQAAEPQDAELSEEGVEEAPEAQDLGSSEESLGEVIDESPEEVIETADTGQELDKPD